MAARLVFRVRDASGAFVSETRWVPDLVAGALARISRSIPPPNRERVLRRIAELEAADRAAGRE